MRKTIVAAVVILMTTPAFATPKGDAFRERQRDCGRQWKVAKADEAVKAAGWPKYWSACNARMKADAPHS